MSSVADIVYNHIVCSKGDEVVSIELDYEANLIHILTQYLCKSADKTFKSLIEKEEADKFNIINAFYTAKLNTKDYTEKLIKASYEKFIPKTTLAQIDESKKAEIDINLRKLLNSLWEYKNYLKFKFIIDDIKKKYAEKEQNKNAYAQTQKEIQTRESKLVKLNAKINGTGLFKKPNEKLNTEANNLILEIKQLYIELDRNKIKEKIFQEINENSTVFDALKLASSYYTYVYYCIQDNIKEIKIERKEGKGKENHLVSSLSSPFTTTTHPVFLNPLCLQPSKHTVRVHLPRGGGRERAFWVVSA